ncbi:MAG: hypothetical protein IJ391_05765 [Clostridia bacterium]|nr:hypothetical protein [Clostridia bacterium]
MKKLKYMALASLVLGIISVGAWLVPPVGYPVSVIGVFLGLKGSEGEHGRLGLAGLVLSMIGLILCVAV